ncbi:sodium:solute symporter [Halomarina halobia]|uniref:Sodium:solute symporter n=1 Tax=Halomarina halobia TaxID=3033386 RepID=A0ABD6AEA2_9EURY|nr:sodium:solute symporter family protein [Halomarina sp. PSR21]
MSAVAVAITAVYLLVTLAIGWYGYRHTGATPAEYFLAGGTLGRVVFPLTTFATLMSAFVFLGSAGFGYIHGVAWFAMIGVEAIAGIPLALIGLRAWRRTRAAGYITPTELLGDTFDSDAVKLTVLAVQFAWAIPYLAVQAMGGGLLFETISEGAVPFWAGALVVTGVTGVYLALGGLRGVAWSDVLQGIVLVTFLCVAFVYVLPAIDPVGITERLATSTELLTPAGQQGFFTPRIWVSFLLMNAMAIVAYPQMFQRFFAARDERSFRALMLWWPIMVLVAAVVPVLLGVWGTELVPAVDDPDAVVPALLQSYAPAWLVGVIVGGALAAMMSTADSLALTLSSLVSRDLYRDHVEPDASDAAETRVGQLTVAVLLAGGYLLALPQLGTIVELAVYFIQGNALLLPVFLAALYWPRATASGALGAVLVGQGYFLASAFGPAPAFGFMPFVPALAAACLALVGGSLLTARGTESVATGAETG